jgi:hypothetical protein
MEVLSEAGRWQKRRRNKRKNLKDGSRDERAVWAFIRRCRASILGCWYISVEGNEMEREKGKVFFPKRSHQWKRIMYFKATLGRKSRYIK